MAPVATEAREDLAAGGVVMSVRLPTTVAEALARAARADRRPRSQFVRNLLADWVAERSKETE